MNNQNLAPRTPEQTHDDDSLFDNEKREYVLETAQGLLDRMEAVRETPDEDLTDHLEVHNSYEISTRLAEAHENGVGSIVEWKPDNIVVTEINEEGDLSQTRMSFIRVRVMGKDSPQVHFRRTIVDDPRHPKTQSSRGRIIMQIGKDESATWSDYETVTYKKRTAEDTDRSFSLPEVENYDSGEIPAEQHPKVVAAFIDKLKSVVESEEAAADGTERQEAAVAGALGETAQKG